MWYSPSDMHADVVPTDVQMCFGPITSCDHDEDVDAHTRHKFNQKSKWLPDLKSQFLQVYIHKYYWNMMHLCPNKGFKITFVDLYIQTAGSKDTGKHNFMLFQYLCDVCHNADPGRSKHIWVVEDHVF